MDDDSRNTLTVDRPIALTSRLTGKTPEGLPVDRYPNKYLPYTCDEIVVGQGGGRLWCDHISRPTQKKTGKTPDKERN